MRADPPAQGVNFACRITVPVYYIVSGWASGTNPCDTLEAAKAACQADYEARIRSALVEVPAVKGEPEPVAWAEIGSRGQALTVRPERSDFCTTPLYAAQPADAGMREALEDAESVFEKIRLILINHLDEPARSAFWKAVEGRDKCRASLTAPGATTKSDGGGESRPANPGTGGRAPCIEQTTPATMPAQAGVATGPSDPSPTRSDVSVEELARTMVHAVYPNSVRELWFERHPQELGADRASTVALAGEYARALKAKYHMEGRE